MMRSRPPTYDGAPCIYDESSASKWETVLLLEGFASTLDVNTAAEYTHDSVVCQSSKNAGSPSAFQLGTSEVVNIVWDGGETNNIARLAFKLSQWAQLLDDDVICIQMHFTDLVMGNTDDRIGFSLTDSATGGSTGDAVNGVIRRVTNNYWMSGNMNQDTLVDRVDLGTSLPTDLVITWLWRGNTLSMHYHSQSAFPDPPNADDASLVKVNEMEAGDLEGTSFTPFGGGSKIYARCQVQTKGANDTSAKLKKMRIQRMGIAA